MFNELRITGGINGIKQNPLQCPSIGIDWRMLRELRITYEEKCKKDFDDTLNNVCSSYRLKVKHSNIRGHHSISICHQNDHQLLTPPKLPTPLTPPTTDNIIAVEVPDVPFKKVLHNPSPEEKVPSLEEEETDVPLMEEDVHVHHKPSLENEVPRLDSDNYIDCPNKRDKENEEEPFINNDINNEGLSTFEVVRNSPIKAIEAKELRTQLLKSKIDEKIQKEENRKRELEAKKEKDRLERIQKREERLRKVAENKAALLKKANEKRKKIESTKEEVPINKINQKDIEKKEKLRLRHIAAEQRRKEKEIQNKQKQRTLEEERLMQEELLRKRMEMKEELRHNKQKKVEQIKIVPVSVKQLHNNQPPQVTVTSSNNKPVEEQTPPNSPTQPLIVSNTVSIPTNTVSIPTSTVSIPTNTVSIPASTVSIPANTVSIPASTVCTNNDKINNSSKYADVSSYSMTPLNQDPLRVADNYDIAELSSGDSSDDEDCPKKTVPMWAAPTNLNRILSEQEYTISHNKDFNVENIFPPEELLKSPDLHKIFRKAKKRFFKRTSSAQWTSPILKKTRTFTNNDIK